MTASARARDAKAGWCSACRREAHALCASPGCECHRMGQDHPNRPEARPAVAAVPAPADPKPKAKTPKAAPPVWELVKATPPPATKKQTPAEMVLPMLETIAEADDTDWWRVALFSTPHAAGRAKAVLAEAWPEEWEWKSARDDEGRPAVFVRQAGG